MSELSAEIPHASLIHPLLDRCWVTIGVMGDRSCPKLVEAIHCRTCPIYTAAGRSLLDREAPANYRQTWAETLAEQAPKSQAIADDRTQSSLSVAIFRLQQEWFALPAYLLKEITPLTPIHTLPHRNSNLLRGLVSIRGELHLCISLANLLELETPDNGLASPSAAQAPTRSIHERMVVVEKNRATWVFPVQEMEGIHHCETHAFEALPTTVAKAKQVYTQSLLHWRDRSVSYLDDELLFYTLNRRILG